MKALLALTVPLLLSAATFEVASLHRSSPDAGITDRESYTGDLLRMSNVTLRQYVNYAFRIPMPQISGGPPWMDDYRFDVVAKTGQPVDPPELYAMLQAFLADRFHLATHHETRNLSGFALTIAKGGLKIAPASPDPNCGTNTSRSSINANNCSMSDLAMRLATALQLPVVDMTGEHSGFTFNLKWNPDELAASSAPGLEAPSLFTALQEQLGVHLLSRKVPVNVLIVDHAEIPTEN